MLCSASCFSSCVTLSISLFRVACSRPHDSQVNVWAGQACVGSVGDAGDCSLVVDDECWALLLPDILR